MTSPTFDKFSASEPGLGYLYQSRLALLRLLALPEDTAVFLEKDDDVDFEDEAGYKSLLSLKHKAAGDRLTNLSIDFWKSVRIWLVRYKRDNRSASKLRFFLFTTATVSDTSFLLGFLPYQNSTALEIEKLRVKTEEALSMSKSTLIIEVANEFNALTPTEKLDFLGRIQIFDCSPRIENIPEIIKDTHFRSIRRPHRMAVFERIEGWWHELIIRKLTENDEVGIFGFEVSDKLSAISEEYNSDNLPITFRWREPSGEIDTENDPRRFVVQLREIGVSSSRIRNAILDYYRAYQQRSEWVREDLLVSGEIENYEDRLVDEWSRFRDVLLEKLDENSAEDLLLQAGKDLYNWADLQSGNIESLRIRARVTEPFVTRGSFHILANATSDPKVYWHPCFLDGLGKVLGVPE